VIRPIRVNPFASSTIVADGTPLDSSICDAKAKAIQCVLHYPLEQSESVLVNVGI
jgi:hypothetical protein